MRRYTIQSVILVNWLGYPFQALPIEDLVLQMHGRNGAGKTTCMLGMVAPLVPDPRRLNKTVQITHNGTGSGLRGVLALDGAPSYAILVLRRGEEWLQVGVMFALTTKNAAGVEASPFVVLGLPPDIKPSEWLLGEKGAILPISGADKAVLRLGGRMRRSDGLKSFYQDLYELQVLPKPLATADDQRLYANTLLNAFNRDPAEIIDVLDEYLLPEEDRLAEFVDTVDGTFRDIVRVREQVGRYEDQEGALRTLWEGADGVLRRAWAWDFLNDRKAGTAFDQARDLRHGLGQKRDAENSTLAAAQAEAERLFAEVKRLAAGRAILAEKALSRADELAAVARQAAEIAAARRRKADFEANCAATSPIADAEAARRLAEELSEHHACFLTEAAEKKKEATRFAKEADALESGAVPPSIASIAARLGGTVLAADPRFDTLGAAEASVAEAALGPRRYAISVDDPEAAARRLVEEGLNGGDIWFCTPGSEFEARADLISQVRGTAAFREGSFVRVSPLPTAPVLGAGHRRQTAADFRRQSIALAEEAAAVNERASKARRLSLEAVWVAENWETAVADMPPGDPNVLRATVSGLRTIANTQGHAGGDPGVEAMPAAERALAIDLMLIKDQHEDATRKLTTARRHEEKAGERIEVLDSDLAKAEIALEQKTKARTAAAERLALWASLTEEQEGLDWIEDNDERQALLFGENFEAGGLQGQIARIATVTVSASRTNPIIRETTERLGIDMEFHFGSLGGNENAPHRASDVINAWRSARRICFSFMPHDVSQSVDPMVARSAIQERIRSLKNELLQAEGVYRDRCAGMLSNINAAITSHQKRIDRLNGDHSDIRFGEFTGIQLKLERDVELLEQFRAVTTRAKEITMAGEAALEDVIEQARRDLKARGTKLNLPPTVGGMLDYRNYVRLKVMVQRGDAPGKWVRLGDSGASTGERMGLGFMCLLMINASWEAADLEIRPRAAQCSLRFIVVDEVSRLDETSLETMVRFAENGSTHIVMAAPQEVPVQGRCRIYTLARVDSSDGRRTQVRRVLPHGRTKRPGSDGESRVA